MSSEGADKWVSKSEELFAKVRAGEFVPCSECGAALVYHGQNSSKHPGIHCENGHARILLDLEYPGRGGARWVQNKRGVWKKKR